MPRKPSGWTRVKLGVFRFTPCSICASAPGGGGADHKVAATKTHADNLTVGSHL